MQTTELFSLHKNQHIAKSNSISKFVLSMSLVSTCVFSAMPAYALNAVSDMGASFPGIGYGAQVLDIVLENWKNPDPSATGTTSITIRLAKDGRPFSCETRAFSSSKITDASFCETIAKIGAFPPYVGTQNPEITLTFRHDSAVDSLSKMPQLPSSHGSEAELLSTASPSIRNNSLGTQNLDPYHTGQNLLDEQTPSLVLDTAPSPTQAQLQQNHNLAQQPILSSDQVNILNSASSSTPPHMQNMEQNFTSLTNPTLTPTMTTGQADLQKSHEPQREITREEALTPPSENLVLPEVAMEEYSQKIFMQARTHIRPPHNIEHGTYSTVARIDISATGGLQNISVQKSSGNKQFDDAVIAVLKNNVTYPPTPNQDQQSIWLTFTIRK